MRRQFYFDQNLTDREKFNFKGPVKQVMQIAYKAHMNGTQVIQGKIIDRAANEKNYITTYNLHGTRMADEEYSPGYFKKTSTTTMADTSKAVHGLKTGSFTRLFTNTTASACGASHSPMMLKTC